MYAPYLTFFVIGLIVGTLLAILIMSLMFSLEIQWREIDDEYPEESISGITLPPRGSHDTNPFRNRYASIDDQWREIDEHE